MTLPAFTARVLTLFPDMFPGPLGVSLLGKALEGGIWDLQVTDIRDFGHGKHRQVDDTPAGGGPGMVMRPDVLGDAVDAVRATDTARAQPLIYLSPRGKRLAQSDIEGYMAAGGVTLLCGRFEGVDERLLEVSGAQEISLGDFVLAGGEIAAMALIEATVRLLPGVVGDPATLEEESFTAGLLEYPQYTRPQVWRDREIPEVLTSGHHGDIATWRRAQAERITRQRRPDLWQRYKQGRADPAEGETES